VNGNNNARQVVGTRLVRKKGNIEELKQELACEWITKTFNINESDYQVTFPGNWLYLTSENSKLRTPR